MPSLYQAKSLKRKMEWVSMPASTSFSGWIDGTGLGVYRRGVAGKADGGVSIH